MRRTLVALTQDLFEWEVIPPDPARPSTYGRFIVVDRDEFSLSCWIDAYMHVADVTRTPGGIEVETIADVERRAIATLHPALHLKGTRTPWTATIRARQHRCVRMAREWPMSRGLRPGRAPTHRVPAVRIARVLAPTQLRSVVRSDSAAAPVAAQYPSRFSASSEPVPGSAA